MAWADRTTVKKGDIGESIVDNFLKSKNVVPYQPVFDGAHPFDRLLATPDKKSLFVADVKTKARRTFYPDTGIDVKHYDEYMHIENKHNLKVFLFFVDEDEQRVYGGWLFDLTKNRRVNHNGKVLDYPIRQGKLIYFPLEAMQPVCSLEQSQCSSLKQFSTRNYQYASEAA
jgi:hypothetical protein